MTEFGRDRSAISRSVIPEKTEIRIACGEERFFQPMARRQKIIRQLGGRRFEQIEYDKKLEVSAAQRFGDHFGIGARAQGVMMLHEQHLYRIGLSGCDCAPKTWLMRADRPTQQVMFAVPTPRERIVQEIVAFAQDW